ncbi:MAG: hypothetical protein ACRD3W_23610, partial [Terriglobales bacterium]
NTVISLDSKRGLSYTNRAFVEAMQGQWDKVIGDCTKAIEINPKLGVAYYDRAIAYRAEDKRDPAKNDMKKALFYGVAPFDTITAKSPKEVAKEASDDTKKKKK